MYGIGFPTATRFRTNQYPLARNAGRPNHSAIRTRLPRPAITINPSHRAITGARNDSFVPAASPAANPATATAAGATFPNPDVGGIRPESAGGGVARETLRSEARTVDRATPAPGAQPAARALTSTATAARITATPTMSLRASPAWNSTSICAPSAIEPPIRLCGPSPYGRPIAYEAVSPSASQAEVDQRREDVAVEGEQRHRVHDLRVRRVVRGEEDRVEVVDRPEVRAVGEPGRQRHVVPHRIRAIHASGEAGERRDHPGRGDHGDGERREPDRAPRDRRRRRGAGPGAGPAPRARPVGDAREHEAAERSSSGSRTRRRSRGAPRAG